MRRLVMRESVNANVSEPFVIPTVLVVQNVVETMMIVFVAAPDGHSLAGLLAHMAACSIHHRAQLDLEVF